jgi:cysteinyl-tRNA synthetase
LRHEINRSKSPQHSALLKALAGTLGFLQADPDAYLKSGGVAINAKPEPVPIQGVPEKIIVGMTTDAATDAIPSFIDDKTGDSGQIDALIEARTIARKNNNYAEADRIRKKLDDAGVILEDRPGGGTDWRRK